ncbi:DUF3577 domain-containing protein, partial [Ectothiorhodospira haloalkaliphila]|uniref:DUF3577 domain-containing protein n=1 Tax=Ectothiorhodospira haloalkaliphila TaxID=421628 RepID=UPI001EE7C103
GTDRDRHPERVQPWRRGYRRAQQASSDPVEMQGPRAWIHKAMPRPASRASMPSHCLKTEPDLEFTPTGRHLPDRDMVFSCLIDRSETMSDTQYFDLHISGLGYLNRAREVSVRRGEPFLAVEVNALHGAADDPQYTRFDCRVNGQEAQALIRQYLDQINDRGRLAADGTTLRHKVLAGFRLGDLYPEVFTHQKGSRQGQTGVSLKARLLKLHWLKVDGRMVYQAQREPTSSASAAEVEATARTPRSEAIAGDAVADPAAAQHPVTDASDDDLDALLPQEVCLSRDDPAFTAKKDRLKSQGYRFDGQSRTWRLPGGVS